ncbi:hypothetical protein Dimus_005561 [Dionaea muscipula]
MVDESDEMLSRGFKDQIYDVYRYLPPELQVVVISFTLPNDILEMTSKFMTDPIRILVKRDELTLEGIKQFFVVVEKDEWKFDTMCDLYDTLTITQDVIFCNTKRRLRMAEFRKEAVTYIEQGHVRVGMETVADPAFHVTRNMQDFITWVDSSSFRRKVLQYHQKLDDYDVMA